MCQSKQDPYQDPVDSEDASKCIARLAWNYEYGPLELERAIRTVVCFHVNSQLMIRCE